MVGKGLAGRVGFGAPAPDCDNPAMAVLGRAAVAVSCACEANWPEQAIGTSHKVKMTTAAAIRWLTILNDRRTGG